jgi:oligopeptide/dipeptide ABC transporter ATP-binding protein
VTTEHKPVLSIRNLGVHFFTDAGEAIAVDGVTLDIPASKTLALVGESGSGKSVTAMSILRLVPDPPGKIVSGSIVFEDRQELTSMPERDLRAIRGRDISMIFQEPMSSLNPVFRIGQQIGAVLELHRKMNRLQARNEAIELLRLVGVSAPEDRVDDYPHQMSGGMRQRVMIAMALACNPKLLIADEPTTALDVTIQAQILELLRRLQRERGMAILLITHDLGIVAENADEVAVMYAGKIVEHASVKELFANPRHPYTIGLFNSLPKVRETRERLATIPGQVPAATRLPSGCRFHPRCPFVMEKCREEGPPLLEAGEKHHSACWLVEDNVATLVEASRK